MTKALTPLGHARVYRDGRSGELVVDTDTIRRSQFAGADFGDEPDDELGEDDDTGDELGEDDDDDDLGEDDELGRSRSQRKRKRNKQKRQGSTDRSQNSRNQRTSDPQKAEDMQNHEGWGMTAISGTSTLTGAGATSVNIRLQHDFKAKDITFDGSSTGATVTSIFFGDRAVWSNPSGIPVSVFGSNSFVRNLLRGQRLRAGLDIVVNGNLTGPGSFSATLLGYKPIAGN